MAPHPIFLSLILVSSDNREFLGEWLKSASSVLEPLVEDYEIVIVDNGSSDGSLDRLRELISGPGIPNVQVYGLVQKVERDLAVTVGIENALGDYVAVIDPVTDSFSMLPKMLDKILAGHDVVFALNRQAAEQSLSYRLLSGLYSQIYSRVHGFDVLMDAPSYRLMTKRVVTYILEQSQAELAYRHLPVSHGFRTATVDYSFQPAISSVKSLLSSMDKGSRLLVSTSVAPLRLVNVLSLFGASANVLYSFYVVAVWMFKQDVAPGWVSLSLQQSGMFFLLSLVLLVLGEYIANLGGMAQRGPRYQIAQEFNSDHLTRLDKLNVTVASDGVELQDER